MSSVNTRAPLGDRLRKSLNEGIEYAAGRASLRTEVVPTGRSYSGEEVTAIRLRRHLSQSQFARLLAVSVKTLQSWEQGVRKPSKPTMRLLQIFDEPETFQRLFMSVREEPTAYGVNPPPPGNVQSDGKSE
jgi:putative transcriptional regulator